MRRGVSPAKPLRTGSNGLRYRFFASLRMTAKGLRMTAKGLRMTTKGLRMTAKGLRMTGQNGEAGIANMIQKRMIEKSLTSQSFFSCGDPYRIQTCNLLIRSQMLYSVELRGQYL